MAGTDDSTSTNSWWPPARARARIAEVYGATQFAMHKLIEWVVVKKVRRRVIEFGCQRTAAAWHDGRPIIGRPWVADAEAYREFLATVAADPDEWLFSDRRISDIIINCEEETASRILTPCVRLVAYGFRVAAEDIENQLAEAAAKAGLLEASEGSLRASEDADAANMTGTVSVGGDSVSIPSLLSVIAATKKRKGSAAVVIDALVPEIYGKDELPKSPGRLRRDIIKHQKAKTPKGRKPPRPPSWDACKRNLQNRGLIA